jgi:hypothetical protein
MLTRDIHYRAVYRPMEHRDQTGAYAVIIGGLTALWASLPALVKAYLLLATARGLLGVAAGLLATACDPHAKSRVRTSHT